jgi:hypothetical protein
MVGTTLSQQYADQAHVKELKHALRLRGGEEQSEGWQNDLSGDERNGLPEELPESLRVARNVPTQGNTFTHTPLLDPSKYIRLLQIEPDGESSAIRCTLAPHPVDNAPPYVAMSYAWGSPNETYSVAVNDRKFAVRSNCFTLLWQCRYTSLRTHYWIDAICIDQDSIPEKNVQVQMMYDIYLNSSNVSISIGLHAGDSGFLFSKMTESFDDGQPDRMRLVWALARLAVRPYWDRLWITQEIAAAKSIVVLCGDSIVQWKTLHQLCESTASIRQKSQIPDTLSTIGGTLSHTNMMQMFKERERSHSNSDHAHRK